MKPIKLILSSFGSYGEKQEISFAHRQQGLFLIAGDTGSGKSTIFDGIMFALYDTMSGRERKGSMMRSEYAREDSDTWVEFTFSYPDQDGEKRYTVRRSPAYQRRSRRKNKDGEYGYTRQLGKVSLIMPDGREYPGKAAEINRKLEEIVGLTKEQFSRMAMIAQGEFQELILDKTGKRKEIFQEIFSTQIYEQMEKRIQERFKRELAQQKESRAQLDTILERVRLPENAEFREEWEDRKKKQDMQPELLEKSFQKLLEQQRADLGRKEEQFSHCQKMLRQAEAALERGKELTQLWDSLEEERKHWRTLQEQSGEYEEKRRQLQQGLRVREAAGIEQQLIEHRRELEASQQYGEKLAKEQKELEQLLEETAEQNREFQERYHRDKRENIQEITLLQQQIPDYKQWEEKKGKWEKARDGYQAAVQEKEKLDKKSALCREEKEKLQQSLDGKEEELPVQQSRLELKKRETEEKERQVKQLGEECGRLLQFQETVEQRRKESLLCEQAWEEIRREAEAMNRSYIAGQAGWLAQSLTEGQPCPVCGSLEHPSPCPVPEESVGEEMLEEIDRREKEGKEAMKQATEKAVRAVEEFRMRHDQICETGQALLADFTLATGQQSARSLLLSLGEEKEEIKRELEECTRKIQEQKRRKERLEELEKEKNVLQEKLEILGKRLEEQRLEKELLERETDQLKGRLTYGSYQEAQAALERQKEKGQLLEREKEKIEKKVQKEKERLDKLLGQQGENSRRIEDGKLLLQKSQNAFEQALAELGYRMGTEWEEEEAQYRQAVEWGKQIEQLQKEREEYEKQCSSSQGRINALEQQLQDREKPELEVLEEQCTLWRQKTEQESQIRQEAAFLCQANRETYQSWKEKSQEWRSFQKKYALAKSLNDAANGKIHFQTYIQRQYFVQIIQAANLRLAKMNADQFLLKCRDIGATGQGELGLDLDVVNPLTGKVRDAHTLSGGETFMASLAMALGLADVVQSCAGATRLDTMFIDEGFGSLSEEVRSMAVKVLLELAGSNRLVGVISHVTELKEQIPDQLIVTKDSRGSHARWELN